MHLKSLARAWHLVRTQETNSGESGYYYYPRLTERETEAHSKRDELALERSSLTPKTAI